jgi:hypothetical protein
VKNRRLWAELTAHEFYPNIAICNVWFSIINDEVFNNKLKPIDFKVQRLRGRWGYQTDDPPLVVLTDVFPSKNLFLNVLAHEMIHVWQYQQQIDELYGPSYWKSEKREAHGPSFWKWEKKFKRNGLALAESYTGHHFKQD